MNENLQERASKVVEDLLEGIELSAQVFRSPYSLLYNLTRLEFLIAHSPSETATDDKPPRDVHEVSEIIPIDEFLGLYDHKERKIVIFNKGVEWASKELKCNLELLRYIVRIHEWAHAIMHLGVDEEIHRKVIENKYDPKVIDDILRNQSKMYKSIEHKLHEVFAQVLTYHCLKTSEEKATKREAKLLIDKMIKIFSELGKRQPHEYRGYTRYLDAPLSRVSQSIRLIKRGWLKGIFDAWNSVIVW